MGCEWGRTNTCKKDGSPLAGLLGAAAVCVADAESERAHWGMGNVNQEMVGPGAAAAATPQPRRCCCRRLVAGEREGGWSSRWPAGPAARGRHVARLPPCSCCCPRRAAETPHSSTTPAAAAAAAAAW